jgi:2-polyprenyl-6-methoxyphenol hydroxylase-like FAD-dependent oxidoreductase
VHKTLANDIAQGCDGRIRTLIVGAGIASLTLAALLRQRGERPAIIERAPDLNQAGYNLALYPLGSRVLHGLGLFDRFLEVSVPAPHYRLGNGRGEIVHDFDMSSLLKSFGPIQGIRRAELLDLLRGGLGDVAIHFGATIAALENREHAVGVTFSDRSSAEFDLVVGADGMHSETRRMMLTEKEFAYWDTGWACWVAWAPEDVLPKETMAEFWGAGRGVGIYPVRGAQGVVLVGPKAIMEKAGRVQFAEQVREQFGKMTGPIAAVVRAVSQNSDAFFWDLHDCRCSVWSRGRVALLGDAAVGFLPTAGVGASMAMLSAAALADELSRADAAHIEYALRLYERHERQKVESAQENSRKLARMMLIESTPLAWGRDQLMRFYTLDRALKEIVAIMEGSF